MLLPEGVKERAQTALGSDISPLISATQATSSTRVKGKPVDTAIACKATRPPPRIRAMATSPSKVHQNTRWGLGELTLPPAEMVSITSEPESDEVTKNTTTSTIPIKEVICASGRASSMVNNCSGRATSATDW